MLTDFFWREVGWSDESECQACHGEEGTEKHRLHHRPEWYEVRREIPEAFRKWELLARGAHFSTHPVSCFTCQCLQPFAELWRADFDWKRSNSSRRQHVTISFISYASVSSHRVGPYRHTSRCTHGQLFQKWVLQLDHLNCWML